MDIKEINLKVSEIIKKEVTEVSYSTWVKFIEDAYMEGNNIIIPVPSDFTKGIIENRYLTLFDNVYCKFMSELNYSKILIRISAIVDETTNDKQEENDKEEYAFKTAKEMREIADKKNAELIDIKKEIDVIMKKVLETINMVAEKGNYSTSYLCGRDESKVVDSITKELENLGFKTKVIDFGEYKKAINIEWGIVDNKNEILMDKFICENEKALKKLGEY